MNDNLSRAYSWRPVFILLAFSFCLLMVAGMDSPLRVPPARCDSLWFFMCGKSWISGLTPYVDFTDSKGPLLWLIYGLGYIWSPYNFYGVFPLQVLFYAATFYVLYRTALLVLRSETLSLLASMLMAFLFFYPGMHNEILSEDYCHLFDAIALFVVVKVFYSKGFRSVYAVYMGLAAAGALMIKYSYFITLLVPSLFVFIYVWSHRLNPLKFTLNFLLGFAVIVLPFVIYFLCVGALDDFVNEYFLNTGLTIVNIAEKNAAPQELQNRWPYYIWYMFRPERYNAEYMKFILFAFVAGVYKFRRIRSLCLVLIAWYGLSLFVCTLVNRDNYLMPLSIFAFPGLIGIVGLFKSATPSGTIFFGGTIVALIAVVQTHYRYSEFYDAVRDKETQNVVATLGKIVNQKKKELGRKPTVTYYNGAAFEIHVAGDAIAGTKYWNQQSGFTEQMQNEYEEDIFRKRPDFVMVYANDTASRRQLETKGYREVITFDTSPSNPSDILLNQTLYEKVLPSP